MSDDHNEVGVVGGDEDLPAADPQVELFNQYMLAKLHAMNEAERRRMESLLAEIDVSVITADRLTRHVQRAVLELALQGETACQAAAVLYQSARAMPSREAALAS